MELEYESLKNELLQALEKNKVWVLATSDGSRVSARSMSIVHDGLDIYFQTSRHFDKYAQMMQNSNVALCCSNVSIEGVASDVGSWEDNPAAKERYLKQHKGSYDAYGTQPGQVVIKVVPHYVVFWKYIDGQPVRDFLYLVDRKAERLFYLEQYPND
ncbi:MAG: pyridoxamine 5'-phosphate oxidase family protein [Anaerolineae bacterium]